MAAYSNRIYTGVKEKHCISGKELSDTTHPLFLEFKLWNLDWTYVKVNFGGNNYSEVTFEFFENYGGLRQSDFALKIQ